MTAAQRLRSLLALARPRMLPYLLLLPLGGYGFAHWDRALTPRGAGDLVWVLVSWALLHAGTLWLNAALDRDESDVLWGSAVPVPDDVAAWGYAALVASVVAGAWADPAAGIAAGIAAVLAVLYSHPDTMWKAHPIGGPVVNAVGYGILSPMAGFAVVDVSVTPRAGVGLALGVVGVLAAYYAAQAFQADEDRARGYRTLVATHGPAAAIRAVRVCVAIGFLGSLLVTVVGWVPRIVLLAAPLVVWVDAYLRRWARQPGGGDSGWAKGLALRLLAAGLVVLGLLLVAYVDDIRAGRPVAGLATAAGHPPDRPLLPPRAMRRWEAAHRRGDANQGHPAGPGAPAPERR